MNTNSYLTFTCKSAGKINIKTTNNNLSVTIYYWLNSVPNSARDNYTGVVTTTTSDFNINLSVGDKVLFYRAETTALADGSNHTRMLGTGQFTLSGNLASLIGFSETIPQFAFRRLFYNNTRIIDASKLELPWNTLSRWCFKELLRSNPIMTKGPELLNVTLADNCYDGLFRECSLLDTVTCRVNSSNYNSNAFNDWLLDASATGTFIKDKDTTWSTGTSGIPSGWTVKNTNQNTQFLDFSSTDRVMYQGNNHVKCIYGPNNTLLWSEEPYFTVEATGTGAIALHLVNTGTDDQMSSIRYYYWKNTIPNAARDNYDGTIVGGDGNNDQASRINYVAGDIIRLYRPEQTAVGNGINNTNRFSAMSNCKIYGNIASLIGYANELPQKGLQILFYYCNFTDCSGLIIPWKEVPQWAFRWMFYGCIQINEIPFLPATTVGVEAYHQIFRQCNSLVNVDLTQKMCCRNANTSAFQNMFFGCTGLTSVVIPTNINYTGNTAWNSAFTNCSALNNVTCLDENPTGNSRFNNWLNGVASTGTFTKKSGVTWSSGASGIPSGWTVQEI